MAINTPKVIDTQMRMPDASSYTWRVKLESTRINRRTDHVINNSQDTPAPRLFSPQVMGYPGSGFGGRVQDASSFTLSRAATALNRDSFLAPGGTRRIQTVPLNASGRCLTRPPASQVVSELGNADESLAGLNMGYMRQRRGSAVVEQVGQCTSRFNPQAKSYFVDTIPELKTRKIGVQSRDPRDNLGRQIVQNPITTCTTTNTSGVTVGQIKAHVPFNSYSAVPKNSIGSGANIVHRTFVTSPTGPQTGGGDTPGSRAPIVGGVSIKPKGSITHRGWANPSRNPYPGPRVPPTGAPAQKKINDPNHYKV
jgi:hypothetical protein